MFSKSKAISVVFFRTIVDILRMLNLRPHHRLVISIAWRSYVSIHVIITIIKLLSGHTSRRLSTATLPKVGCWLHVDKLAKVRRTNFGWKARSRSLTRHLNDLWNSRRSFPTLSILLIPLWTSLMIWHSITLLSPLRHSQIIICWITGYRFVPWGRWKLLSFFSPVWSLPLT
jgi:hypothetical protein